MPIHLRYHKSKGLKRIKRNRRRHKFDIYADILEVALKGARKTHIVGRANLNFLLIRRYLPKLVEWGLISKTQKPFESRYLYRTTSEGLDFLDNYLKLLEAIGEAEERNGVIVLRNKKEVLRYAKR